jgi:ubiquinol-cytochrome c reductase cytochrome c subunit
VSDDDVDIDAELGFEPAVSATGADLRQPRRASKANGRTRRGLPRRVGAAAVVVGALFTVGAAYAAFASSSSASGSMSASQQVAEGRQLFSVSCITCHGANLQGVKNRGPALIGVGSAAAQFQLSTGRMPATGQAAEMLRKPAKFDTEQTLAIAAYIQSVGGGPPIPTGPLTGGDIAQGGALFRLNCASCHGATGKGAPLSGGKSAPSLNDATDLQLWTAMLSGPESMPRFPDNLLTPSEKREITSYIQTIKASDDPGGAGLDRIGPVSEAIVLWVGGVGILMIVILWIGAKSQ